MVNAHTAEGEIMGVRHKEYPIHGVQFHPESILTRHGKDLLKNFLRITGEFHAKKRQLESADSDNAQDLRTIPSNMSLVHSVILISTMKHLLSNPAYKMACDQFDAVADFMNMPEALRERTKLPKRMRHRLAAGAHGLGRGESLRGPSRAASPHARADQGRAALSSRASSWAKSPRWPCG